MTSPNIGPWWVPASRNGKANFITRSNAILLAFVAGLVGAIFGASSSGSLFGQSINLSRVTNSVERAPGSVADLAQRVIPSVVSIEASSRDGGSTGTGFVIDNFFGGSKVSDPAQRDPKTVALRESGKSLKNESEDWVVSLIPTGDGLLLATK